MTKPKAERERAAAQFVEEAYRAGMALDDEHRAALKAFLRRLIQEAEQPNTEAGARPDGPPAAVSA